MGPLRRRLIALALLMPSTAWAEVCDKERPNWVPGTDATAFTEMIAMLGTPPSLILLVATAVAVRFRSAWGALIVVLGWTAWTSAIVFLPHDPVRAAAVKEGCIGNPSLFIAFVATISVAMIIYTSRGDDTPDKTET